ncbi:MAG: tetratricopeptide repeat protein, partial [Alphaproteobacteria bacterium]|nr:tetratricopeptide repeat protein [Alphaproteobacteria bacterium]
MPDNANEIARASEALNEGRIDEAGRLLSRILEQEPENAEAHHLCAIQFLHQRAIKQALEHAQRSVALEPESGAYHGHLGSVLVINGRLNAALPHLDKAIAESPDDLVARRNRGKLYVMFRRFEDAVEDLSRVVDLEPDNAEARVDLAYALIEVRRLLEAAEALKTAQKIEGKQSADWRYTWGRLMYRMGLFSSACDAFAMALMAAPSKMNHYLGLAAACFHAGDLRRAEEVTRAAFQRFPYSRRVSGAPELRVLVLEAVAQKRLRELPHGAFIYRRGNFITHMPPGRIAYTHVMA